MPYGPRWKGFFFPTNPPSELRSHGLVAGL